VTGQLLRGDSDLDLKLSVGESRELSLASLGTAGFVWTYQMEGDDGIVRLSRRRGRPEQAGPIGRSTPEQLMIQATAPGHAVIRMQQARPWESKVAPRKSFAINVQVSPI
jgi:inhibitor of cysteine peptidase